MKTPTVTVIIPVFNTYHFLQECLDSVYNQTFQDFEIIMVNDGSTDPSSKVIARNILEHGNVHVIHQNNSGQGVARNKALARAKGEFVLFLDADDLLEKRALELTVARIQKDSADFVHFDWKYYYKGGKSFRYKHTQPYFHKDTLIGSECDELLRMKNYFSVNNLYRRSFLDKHKIRYGEKYIYEDYIFVVKSVNRAKKISLLHAPLYIVRPHAGSTTKTNHDSDRHYKGFLAASKDCLEQLDVRTPYTRYYLVKYLLRKFLSYYEVRIPKRLKRSFVKEFVDLLSRYDDIVVPEDINDRFVRYCIDRQVFVQKKYLEFFALVKYFNHLKKYKKSLQKKYKKAFSDTTSDRVINIATPPEYKEALKNLDVRDGTIIFLGFDFRYTGNSKYLYDTMVTDKRFNSAEIYFVTNDKKVAKKHRVAPNTKRYYELLATSAVVIAESWLPVYYGKRYCSTLIQLWHGTPLKKMLFDSNEEEITRTNRKHKSKKYHDILQWDYMVADSEAAVDKFKTSFMLDDDKLVLTGYPRVKYLIDNQNNKKLVQSIKKDIGIKKQHSKSKIVLYAPTWRDYNYGRDIGSQDYNYILDLNRFAEQLGDEYIVLYKDHHYLSEMPGSIHGRCYDVGQYETQDLLLATDYLVTDYSSIMFDAFAVNIPTVLYANDYDEYARSRGVYDDMWSDLRALQTDSVEGVTDMIKSGTIDSIDCEYLRQKYGYMSRFDLLSLIDAHIVNFPDEASEMVATSQSAS